MSRLPLLGNLRDQLDQFPSAESVACIFLGIGEVIGIKMPAQEHQGVLSCSHSAANEQAQLDQPRSVHKSHDQAGEPTIHVRL